MRDNIPLLREIHIFADSQSGYAGQNIFEFAPALKIVRVTEPRLHADNPNINWMSADYNPNYNDSFMWPEDPPFEDIFPWDQLTHYESQCMDPYHFDALCQAENLVVRSSSGAATSPGIHPPSSSASCTSRSSPSTRRARSSTNSSCRRYRTSSSRRPRATSTTSSRPCSAPSAPSASSG
ncbi:hypothetical protein FB451DRAFT_459621 [Mycena latifolia]|nr:hypothetical protein FB451DRAFT_459621 [Mycena latifolia]